MDDGQISVWECDGRLAERFTLRGGALIILSPTDFK